MKTTDFVLHAVNNSLGLNHSSPTPYICPKSKKTGGSQLMGSYAQNNSISIFFGATSNQVTNNN